MFFDSDLEKIEVLWSQCPRISRDFIDALRPQRAHIDDRTNSNYAAGNPRLGQPGPCQRSSFCAGCCLPGIPEAEDSGSLLGCFLLTNGSHLPEICVFRIPVYQRPGIHIAIMLLSLSTRNEIPSRKLNNLQK